MLVKVIQKRTQSSGGNVMKEPDFLAEQWTFVMLRKNTLQVSHFFLFFFHFSASPLSAKTCISTFCKTPVSFILPDVAVLSSLPTITLLHVNVQ